MNSFASFFVPIWFSSIYTDTVFGYILFFQPDGEKNDYSKQRIDLKSVQFTKLLHKIDIYQLQQYYSLKLLLDCSCKDKEKILLYYFMICYILLFQII